MGFHTYSRILSWKLPPSAKMVLCLLAHHQDDRTGRCDPSVARLVAESGLAIRTVYYALRQLTACRAIMVRAKPHHRSSYIIAEIAPEGIAAGGGDEEVDDDDGDHPAGHCTAGPAGGLAPAQRLVGTALDARRTAAHAPITASAAQDTATHARTTAPGARITTSGAEVTANDALIPATAAQKPARAAQMTATVAPYHKDQKDQKRIRADTASRRSADGGRAAGQSGVTTRHHPGGEDPRTFSSHPGGPGRDHGGRGAHDQVGPEFLDDQARPWRLGPGHLDALERDYADLDVAAVLDDCAHWCEHHPEWRRPPGAMFRAIQTWFSRERTHARQARATLPEIYPTLEEARAVLFPHGRRPQEVSDAG